MLNGLLTLHLLATIVWVGGMFFAHMALRPAVNEMLEPGLRLPLMYRVLSRFFPWVWFSIGLLLISGLVVFLVIWKGQGGMHIHIMSALGILMMVIFSYIYFMPYRRMGKALEMDDLAAAAAHMGRIRMLIGVNLVLGLVTSIIANAGLF